MEELRSILLKHCARTCRWSKRVDDVMYALQEPLSKVFDAEAEIHGVIKYSTLTRKFRAGRLGICRPCNRVDVCALCTWFDYVIGNKVEEMIDWTVKELAKDYADIQHHMDESIPAVAQRSASWVWCSTFMDFIKEYVEDGSPERAKQAVEFAEAHFVGEEGMIQLLKEMAAHWWARDTILDGLWASIDQPEEGVTYIWWDFGDPHGEASLSRFDARLVPPKRASTRDRGAQTQRFPR